jgi:galactose mutarotase-like enzyme
VDREGSARAARLEPYARVAVPRPIVDPALVRNGVAGLALEGDHLRVTVFPAAGAKILDLVHTPSGVDLLWKNPRVPLAATYPGPAFDDVWCGGWDELFPTDPPCDIGGNHYSDHGDLWHGPWEWEIVHDDGHEATVYLRRFAVALPCLMEKWITLRRDGLEIGFRHRLTNVGACPEPYTWSLHVAHAIGPGSRIVLPATRLGLADAEQARFGTGVREVAWPLHDGEDLQQVLGPERGLTEWLYTLDAREGSCAVLHDTGVGLELTFDPSVFTTTWTWGVYGGWRGHYVLLTEPSTSPPGGLAVNVAAGTAPVIEPGAVLETSVSARVVVT